ncbi:hypothetical protein GCM10022234_06960 [Aeromicrobium panaciterrae]|uniref:maleylpyruvate isomerase N-terminal domain-containing protein n=1 Tax=Aeromicrobium panaciterrae TaxID=363861 RepID=UPI0031D3BECF
MEPLDRSAFVAACHAAFSLASSSEVARAWDKESTCVGMTVGGLTHHLLAQAGRVVSALDTPPTTEPPILLLDHYARADWVTAGPDDEANRSIRVEADESAADGHATVLAQAARALAHLPEVLAAPRTPDSVYIPWQRWALTTNDFLVTRSMEVVVHSDDLAASVGLAPPEFPDAVVEQVIRLLTGVARRRHGTPAIIRALSRPQRAPVSVSAF